jgi:hypothetical protein
MDAKTIGDIAEAHLFKQRAGGHRGTIANPSPAEIEVAREAIALAQGADATAPPSARFDDDLLELLGREVARIGRLSDTVQEWSIGRS